MLSPSTNSKNPFFIPFANLLKYINSIIFLFPRRTIDTFQLTLYINSRLFFRFFLFTFSSFTKKIFPLCFLLAPNCFNTRHFSFSLRPTQVLSRHSGSSVQRILLLLFCLSLAARVDQ